MKTDQLLSIPASRFNKGQATEEVLASKVLNHALVHDEEEDYGKLMRVNTEAPFETLIESHLNEERANGMLIKRSMQANIHAAYTQQRIKELEEKLNEVRKDLYKLPDDFNLRKGKRIHPTFRHVLQRSSPAQFNLTRESMDLPEKDRPALEVLVIERLKSPETQPDSRVHHRRPTGLLEDPSYTYQVPERLRIRPRPLIAHLQRVTHIHISDELGPGISGIKQSSIVFLRPFKLLVTYEEQIRQSLLKLEKENHERSIRQEGRAQKEEDEKTFNFEDLLQDLKLLVDFLDGDLRPTFDLREKIRDGTATDIEYHDLWHLFRHGDIVTVESDPSHAYRVVNFGGGREPLVDQLPEDRNLDKQSQPFLDGMMIDCVSIKYDGSNYVPHLDTFSIRSYSGRQPITSLPVYPFRFNEDSVSLKQALIAQGMRYLDVTIPPQSHKHLAGRTLDEPPHDIDAQVIIDTSMALNKVPNWRPQTDKIYKDQLTKGDPRETRIPSYCRHYTTPQGCCGGDVAFKDLQIDALNLNKFFQASPYLMSPRTHIRLAEEDMTLLPDNVHGFVLRNRQWITLRVADLSEARFESVFDELMLPERHKSTIQALVQVHESAVTRTGNCRPTIGNGIDLVRGKGAGLILLLHGEPGKVEYPALAIAANGNRGGKDLNSRVCGGPYETTTFPHHLW
jgi:hypothetical protein